MSLSLKEYGLALPAHLYQPPLLLETEFKSIMNCSEYAEMSMDLRQYDGPWITLLL